jgi:hypothetical protein
VRQQQEDFEMRTMCLFLYFCLLLPSLQAGADMYKWVDDKGVTHYGDRIPPEYVNQGNTQLNKRGVQVRKTEPALTSEQRRAQQEEAERLKEGIKLAEEQQRQDIALINTYSTEQEIDLARDRRAAQIEQIIVQAQLHASELAQRAAVVEQEFKRARAPSAKATAEGELTGLVKQQAAMRAAIAKLNADKQQVIATFNQDKERFREIKANGVTSTRLTSVARRSGEGRVTELALNVSDPIVAGCVEEWRDTSTSRVGAPYAVAARLIARGEHEEVVVEGRSRSSTTGQSQVRRWTCPLTAGRTIDKRETDIRKALASIGAQY